MDNKESYTPGELTEVEGFIEVFMAYHTSRNPRKLARALKNYLEIPSNIRDIRINPLSAEAAVRTLEEIFQLSPDDIINLLKNK